MKNEASYNILIVDDNKNNRLSLKTLIMEYIKANVIEADGGKKALQEILRNSIDLIILDVQMDGMDGFELASLIKQRRKTQDIPIMFLTAMHTNDEFKRRGFEVGAVDYLTKPIDEYQLINRVNVYLKIIEKERNINKILERRVEEQVTELIKAKELAEQANETKNTFLANISHELRTPLNILLSTNQLLKLYLDKNEELDRQKIKNRLDTQSQNCFRLLRLVNNLIDITKIDSGYFNLNKGNNNIIKVIEEVVLSVVDYIEDKGISLIFDTDVEEKHMGFDQDAIERIMLNLLSNAVKFTPFNGTIYVNIKDLDETLRVSVSDTGIGIKEDKLKIIFERFRQVDSLLTRQREGSGIGLSLVKALVEMHGGSIFVESEYEKGSEFVFELPVITETEQGDKGPLAESSATSDIVQRINVEFSDIYFDFN